MPTVLVADGHSESVGLLHGFDLLVCQADVKGCDGIGEVVFLGGTDDRCGYYGVVQHPGEGDVRHRDPAFFCNSLNCVGNRFVRVAEATFGYGVVGGPCSGTMSQKSHPQRRNAPLCLLISNLRSRCRVSFSGQGLLPDENVQ